MKKIGAYILLMIILIIVLPLIIVRNLTIVEEPKVIKEQSDKTINVYVENQKKVVTMKLEEYLLGVVSAEMPASYDPEALKAQAVAARTYALGRAAKLYVSKVDTSHNGADVCTNPAHCQAWISKDVAMKRWGLFTSFKYWNKIGIAVNSTVGQVIEYNNEIINPLFHSNSGGHTENVEDVWTGISVPYLTGVVSLGEDSSSEYKNKVILEQQDMIGILLASYPNLELIDEDLISNIEIKKYSSSDRVVDMKIGNITMKGTEFRKLFSLKSTNFKIEKLPSEKISITTIGYGHGVGMSQCGANYLAYRGTNYIDILKYYYKGVEIKKIK